MAKFNTNRLLNQAVKIGTEFMMLNLSNTMVNSLPNIPPIVKTITQFSTAIGGALILKQAVNLLPSAGGPIKGIANAMIGAQVTIQSLQALPGLIAALQSGNLFTVSQ